MNHSLTLQIHIRKPIIFYVDYILVFIFFALTLYIFLFNYSTLFFYIRYAFLFIAAVRGYYISIQKKCWSPILIAVLFALCYLLCVLCQRHLNFPVNSFTYTILYIGLAVLLLEGAFGIRESGLLFIVCAVLVLFRYIQGNINNVLTYTSRNFISVLLLFTLLLYYLALYKSGRDGFALIFVPALIFFGISVLAYGRGGILSSAFLLFAIALYKSFETQNKRTSRGLRIFAVIAVVLIVVYLIWNNQLSFLLGKFSTGVTDEARLNYWGSFLGNNFNSVGDFLFGSDLSLIRSTDNNIHNSFLQAYGNYGLIAFIFIIVMCLRSLIKSIQKKDYFLFTIMLTLFIRAFLDRLFFQGYCEVFLFYFILMYDYKYTPSIYCGRKTNNALNRYVAGAVGH